MKLYPVFVPCFEESELHMFGVCANQVLNLFLDISTPVSFEVGSGLEVVMLQAVGSISFQAAANVNDPVLKLTAHWIRKLYL